MATWSNGAKDYADGFAPFTSLFAKDAAAMLVDALPPPTSSRSTSAPVTVMDISCGSGAATFQLVDHLESKQLLKGATVHATDFAAGMVEVLNAAAEQKKTNAAEKWGTFDFKSAVADAGDLSAYPSDSFDGLLWVFGILFVPDYVKAIQELKRLLKPGGTAVVLTWHYNSTWTGLSEVKRRQGDIDDTVDLLPFVRPQFLSEVGFRRMFHQGGFPEPDVEVKWIQHSYSGFDPKILPGMAQSNPAVASQGPYDPAIFQEVLVSMLDPETGLLPVNGTAIAIKVTKAA